ncbi:MAG: hypothetical protein VX733_09655 [Candidatus Latescibacterota bacterium]|nr:hypothetical protein [Candidatus Latescibacterota bacterium]
MQPVCFHIPDFSSWALLHRWQEADESPVVVCSAGKVFSCSPMLRRRGIEPGNSVDHARRLIPDAQFLPRDHAVESALWDNLLARLHTLTPQVQPLAGPNAKAPVNGRDCRSDVNPQTPATGLWDNGAWALLERPDFAGLIRFTEELGAQVGISTRRSWAMLAAAYSNPGGTTTVPGHMVRPFLDQAPIQLLESLCFKSDLPERLQLFGMRAIGHAMSLTQRQLTAQFGTEGRRLFQLLHPGKVELPIAHYDPRVARAEYDFDSPVFEPRDLQPVLYELLAQLQHSLGAMSARHLEVRLKGRGPDNRTAARILHDPTRRLDILHRIADVLLADALSQPLHRRLKSPSNGRSVHRITVVLSGLSEVEHAQSELFHTRPDLKPLIRTVEARFPGKLLRPVQTHADPFFPEEEYYFEPVAP